MKNKIEKLNRNVNSFLEDTFRIKNPKFRKAIVITLWLVFLIFSFGLWPFIIGIYLILVVQEKISNNKLRYSFAAVVILLTFLFGIPWANAIYGDNKETPQRETTVKTNDSTPIKTFEAETKSTTPKTDIKEETKTESFAFAVRNEDDATLEKGQTKVKQEGKDGIKELKYRVTYTDNKETARQLLSETVTTQPIDKVISIGTKVVPTQSAQTQTTQTQTTTQASGCDPNYSGACVPIASDVDCLGGGGNGPAYVKGPVYVIGKDIYGLDRDGNGVACEN